MDKSKMLKNYCRISFLIVFSGLTLMYFADIFSKPGVTFFSGTIRFLGFFTILTNILVAFVFASSVHDEKLPSQLMRSCVLVYILITGSVYFIMLRNVWNPEGFVLVADIILHYISPALYLLYWILTTGKERYGWNIFWKALIFPAAYFAYTITRGSFTGHYPYPFIDVAELGAVPVLINSLVVLLAFDIITVVAVVINNKRAKRSSST